MDIQAIKQCLAELEDGAGCFLRDRGFESASIEMPDSEFEWKRWARENSWKRDLVELAVPREKAIALVDFVEIHLRVNLRYPDNDRGLFDGTTLNGLCKERSGHYYIPKMLWPFKNSSFARYRTKILRDLAQGFNWFYYRETPERCIELLRGGNTSVGSIDESGAAREALNLLLTKVKGTDGNRT